MNKACKGTAQIYSKLVRYNQEHARVDADAAPLSGES